MSMAWPHTTGSCSRSRVPAVAVVLAAVVDQRISIADESALAWHQMHLHRFHRRRQVGAGERAQHAVRVDRADQWAAAEIGEAVERAGGAVEIDIARLRTCGVEVEPG